MHPTEDPAYDRAVRPRLAAHRLREKQTSRGPEWYCSCGFHLGCERGGTSRAAAAERHRQHQATLR